MKLIKFNLRKKFAGRVVEAALPTPLRPEAVDGFWWNKKEKKYGVLVVNYYNPYGTHEEWDIFFLSQEEFLKTIKG